MPGKYTVGDMPQSNFLCRCLYLYLYPRPYLHIYLSPSPSPSLSHFLPLPATQRHCLQYGMCFDALLREHGLPVRDVDRHPLLLGKCCPFADNRPIS